MENQRRKWVSLSYVLVAILFAYILGSVFHHLAATFDLEIRIRNIELVIQGVSALLGLITFWVLSRHEKANEFMDEVVLELSRVTWPTQKDTSRATVVVMVMVLISSVVLGALDTLWTWILKFVI